MPAASSKSDSAENSNEDALASPKGNSLVNLPQVAADDVTVGTLEICGAV